MAMKEKLKAALYIRVSTEEQAEEGLSVSAQTEILKQYCSAYNIEVSGVYADLGFSGKRLKDRKELGRLLEDCAKGCFDLVLVWKISRLSRNLKDLLYLIDVFEKHDVHFASYSEMFDTSTPVGRMTLQLLGSIAEFERNTIVENVKLGLREFARQGGKASSVLGYDNVDKKLVVNEQEAGIVKLIFSLYTETAMSFTAIAEYLNSQGYRTKRGSKFRCSNISYIIRNPVYIGLNRHGMNSGKEYLVQGTHPPIIDASTWSKAQSLIRTLTERKTAAGSGSDPLPFRVLCKKCGSLMKVFYTRARGKKYKYMRCGSCSNYVNAEKLKKAAVQVILRLFEDAFSVERVYEFLKQTPAGAGTEAAEIAAIEAETAALKKSRARYLSLFEGYKISGSKAFIERMEEIDARLKTLERKKNQVIKAALDVKAPIDYKECLRSGIFPGELYSLVNYAEAFGEEINFVLYL